MSFSEKQTRSSYQASSTNLRKEQKLIFFTMTDIKMKHEIKTNNNVLLVSQSLSAEHS